MLDGYKTYMVALGAFLIALGVTLTAYGNGAPIDWHLLVEALIALAMIFLRKGIKKAS